MHSKMSIFRKIFWLRMCTFCVLYWEKLIPDILPLVFGILFYLGLSITGYIDYIGDPWRLGIIFCFLVFSFYWVRKRIECFLPPGSKEIDRRLEMDSGLKDRPFETLQDHPVIQSERKLFIWRLHQLDAKNKLTKLNVNLPERTYLAYDRFALYVPIILFFILISILFRADLSERLKRSFKPGWLLSKNTDIKIRIWLEPPEYTHQSAIMLADMHSSNPNSNDQQGKQQRISILNGTRLKALVSGSQYKPSVNGNGGNFKRNAQITKLKGESYQINLLLEGKAKKQDIQIKTPGFSQTWHFQFLKDLPPKIHFLEAEKNAKKQDQTLSFYYQASDDYGLQSIALLIEAEKDDKNIDHFPKKISQKRKDQQNQHITHYDHKIQIPFYQSGSQEIKKERVSLDLAEHSLAGQTVVLRLIAVDSLGQQGVSVSKEIILPEHVFVNPLAKSVIEQRKILMYSSHSYLPLERKKDKTIHDFKNRPVYTVDSQKYSLERAPDEIKKLADMMRALLDLPHYFYDDITVYMGLRYVLSRIEHAEKQLDLNGLAQTMWQIAQRAEFGNLADALSALKTAEKHLSEALARKAPKAEFEVLFERYKSAVKAYLRVLASAAIEEGRVHNSQANNGALSPSNDQFAEALKAIEEAYQLGLNRDARLTSQKLRELLEQMKLDIVTGSGGSGQENMIDEVLADLLKELGEVISQQRDLKKQTEKQARQNQNANKSANKNSTQHQNTVKGNNNQSDQTIGMYQGDSFQEKNQKQNGETLGLKQENASGLQNKAQSIPSFGLDSAGQIKGLQNALRKEIESLSGNLSKDQETQLQTALNEMENAARALEQERFQDAVKAQNRVIGALRGLNKSLVEHSIKGDLRKSQDNLDPLGRILSDDQNDLSQSIDKNNLKRAREILEELKRRRNQTHRSKEEINYLERLLERFKENE